MCGIAGWYEARGRNGAAMSAEPLLAMLREMTPRGPDDAGHVEVLPRQSHGRWLLGACRLAILDLSMAGHQPMHDPQTGNWLVYNGEIFNFGDLRRELEAAGCAFQSNCDTEVLLHGYRVWGEDVLQRARGMFAFGIWDEARQTLLLARDRLGIKPVYYYQHPERFLFASELRALLESGFVPRELDPTGLDSFLKFGAVQEPATLIRDIRLLPAGHLLRWRDGRIAIERYWSLPAQAVAANGSEAERQRHIEEVRESLAESVRIRLVSDVPLGIFLSGGLDSSVVAALAAQSGNHIQTFTINFTEKRFAEGAKARRVAEHLGSEHMELLFSQRDLLPVLPEALAAMDQPTVDGINTYFVSRLTKQAGVTVALSGLGGDELFAGYRSFRMVPRMEQADRWMPHWARALAGSLLDARMFRFRRDRKFSVWVRREDGFGHPFYLSRLVLTPARVARLFQPEWLLAIEFSVYEKEVQEVQRLIAGHDAVNRVSCLELTSYLRNTLLRDTDCMSMANSLEVRVPLIDHVVTEQMLRLPGAWKLGRQRKPLLVAALEKPLPADILQQPKRGFEFPWDFWLRGELRGEVEETLAEPGPALAPMLQWEGVRQLWSEFLDGRVHWSRVWLFYVLRKWTDRHIQ
ncbi:MAG: asparagine synthase (glutamine-hydrolyzing) [Acidobacteria bacterium]|nr:asparagine synthase (glutamine-hydrolyzing) [Acidobacteriota bacterium]